MPFVGGTRVFLENMARRLVADGNRVIVLTTNARRACDFWEPPTPTQPPLPGREMLDGVLVVRVPLTYPWPAPHMFGVLRRIGLGLQLGRVPRELARPVQRFLSRWMPPVRGLAESLARCVPQVDLVHTDDGSWDGLFLATACAARRYGRPLVVRPLMHLGSSWVRAHHQMAHQVQVYRDAAAVFALSRQEAEAFAALGTPRSRIRDIRMGVEPHMSLSREVLDGPPFRRELAIEGPFVAFVGANTYDKGAFALVKAVVQLNLQGMSVDLVYAGPQEGNLRTFLQRQPSQVQSVVRDRVHVLGIVDEVTKHRLLAACDLLALPSQVDTFGIVFLEAWLHSRPVIGANAGGIPDLVRHEDNGLLVPFDDVDALAVAIGRLLTEPGLAVRLGSAGRRELHRYTWDATYQTLLRVYQSVLTGAA